LPLLVQHQKGLLIQALATVFKIAQPLILLIIQASFALQIVGYMVSINIAVPHLEAAKISVRQTLWHMAPLPRVIGNA